MSSGGNWVAQRILITLGYQVREEWRDDSLSHIFLTDSVFRGDYEDASGRYHEYRRNDITTPRQAYELLVEGEADGIAREFLHDTCFVLCAANDLSEAMKPYSASVRSRDYLSSYSPSCRTLIYFLKPFDTALNGGSIGIKILCRSIERE